MSMRDLGAPDGGRPQLDAADAPAESYDSHLTLSGGPPDFCSSGASRIGWNDQAVLGASNRDRPGPVLVGISARLNGTP
jgi:hypothetical protein